MEKVSIFEKIRVFCINFAFLIVRFKIFRTFETIATQLDKKIDYVPIVLLLGFFVMKVLQRWQGIFENIGFIDG